MSTPEYNPEFAQQLVGARRGFHELALERYGLPVIDHDVSPINRVTSFHNVDDAISRYRFLQETMPMDEPDGEILADDIRADIMYGRALTDEEIPFDEYALATIGLVPELVPEAEIDDSRAAVESLLQEQGLQYDEAGRDQFLKTFVLTDTETIKARHAEAQAAAIAYKRGFMDLPDSEINTQFEPFPGKFWAAGYSATPEGADLTINTAAVYTLGRIAAVGIHEHTHDTQVSVLLRQGIALGDINPAAGVTSITSPVNTHLEAAPQLMEHTLPIILRPEEQWQARFHLAYTRLRFEVEHNTHLMINDGKPEAEVLAYAVERLPFEPADRILQDLQAGRDDPIARAAIGQYIPAFRQVEPLLAVPTAVRQRAIVQLMSRPLTLRQVEQVVQRAQTETAIDLAASL
jgi:hypothetical protein